MTAPLYHTIIRPILTERSTILKEKFNQYIFEVAPTADKEGIKKAVKELFKVDVTRVRTMTVRGKYRRFGQGGGYRSNWKKAIVTLKEGQKIDVADQAA